MLKTKEDILQVIEQDADMMAILRTTKRLSLPDCWVSAGFVRSKIWDEQQGFQNRSDIPDVYVVYFDLQDTRESTEKIYEKQLSEWMPEVPWSVKDRHGCI